MLKLWTNFTKFIIVLSLTITLGNMTCSMFHLSTIPVELWFLWDFEVHKLKTCSLYHKNLLLQKFNEAYTQVLIYFFSASDIMEAVRGCFRFYDLTTVTVELGFLWDFEVLKLKTCSLYHENVIASAHFGTLAQRSVHPTVPVCATRSSWIATTLATLIYIHT